ncbi:hypothetical protein RB653_002920 [Dictyostelium firmibasis]|uniref:E1 ubiquitin-activating enzyme n=1 Tax=Dictyostelium firmibasis TaxID=79012 RepID=A0AAN7YW07_9MYCE
MDIEMKVDNKQPSSLQMNEEINGHQTYRDNNLDDSLYSRQRYVLGDFAMSKLSKGDVFLSGLGGVGVEIAKNIILAGIKSITLHDTNEASIYDLSSQFYINPEHIDQKLNRATISQSHLQELNPYVKVNTIINSSLSDLILNNSNSLLQFKCIILTESNLNDQIEINEFCRKNDIKFIVADCYGLCGWVFNDFGDQFKVYDKNGEELKEVFISNISTQTSPNQLIITCMENHMHGFEENDFIQFKEIIGMDQLNDPTKKFKINIINSNCFSIHLDDSFDIKSLSPYQRGGIAVQTKSIETLQFKPLSKSITEPEIIDFDFMKDTRFNHLIRHCIEIFKQRNENQLPREFNKDDSMKFIEIVNEFNENCYFKFDQLTFDQLKEDQLIKISNSLRGKICPLTSVIGGFVAQEALKSLTGKFTPLKQWLYIDCFELLPSSEQQLQELSSQLTIRDQINRKYSQKLCLGELVCDRLSNTKLFMVGSGAIGCEMLKNYALLSVATNPDTDGLITITDNDLIEKSNLNRQFLFRNKDINQWKSKVAALATQSMNSSIKIQANQDKIEGATENIYNDDFYNQLDVVVSALDNVEARLYLDKQCVSHSLPLLESGTLGTKGHVQVILPYLTESYASQKDPNEKQTPFCTLKSFPTNLDHCIQWSRDKFEKFFAINPLELDKFLNQPHYLQQLLNSSSSNKISTSRTLSKMMDNFIESWSDCIIMARIKFEKLFNHNIRQLLKSYPLDLKTKEGIPFWTLPKRPPTPLIFNKDDELHLSFIRSLSLLYSQVYNLPNVNNNNNIDDINKSIKEILDNDNGKSVPEFKPKNKTIISDEKASAPVETFTLEQFQELTVKLDNQLSNFKSSKIACNTKINYLSFEKDDDSNHHIDFITSISNLRARIYQIQESDRFKVKLIAGKIIPAIATTTSVIAGFVSLELIKIVSTNYYQFKKYQSQPTPQLPPIENFKNYFVNLALPSFQTCEPGLAPKIKVTNSFNYTLWDNWEINQPDITIGEFNQYFGNKYRIKVSGIYQDVSLIYMAALPSHKKRLSIPIKNLLSDIDGLKYIDLFVSFVEEDDTDAKGPPIRFIL